MSIIDKVVTSGGDLSKLSKDEQALYYKEVCESVGLNPLTEPFKYITLNGKLQLYATRAATEQLRKVNGISLTVVSTETIGDVYIVRVRATDKTGRVDESTGVVSITGVKGDALANTLMKAETKAKRRVTLSISGLGYLDETEIETIPGAVVYPELSMPKKPEPAKQEQATPPQPATQKPAESTEPQTPAQKTAPMKETPAPENPKESTQETLPNNVWEVLVDGTPVKKRGKNEFSVNVIIANSEEFSDVELIAPLEYKELATQGATLIAKGEISNGVLQATFLKDIVDDADVDESENMTQLLATPVEAMVAYKGRSVKRPAVLCDIKSPDGYSTFLIGNALKGLAEGDVITFDVVGKESDDEKKHHRIYISKAEKYTTQVG